MAWIDMYKAAGDTAKGLGVYTPADVGTVHPFTIKGGNYTVSSADTAVLFTATATATLPSPSAVAAGHLLLIISGVGATTTVTAAGGTNRGAASVAATTTARYISDGVSSWWVA